MARKSRYREYACGLKSLQENTGAKEKALSEKSVLKKLKRLKEEGKHE